MRRGTVTALLCTVFLYGGVVYSQRHADGVRAVVESSELFYLPNEKLLTHFTGGMSSVIADLVWLRCVQYVGTEVKGERSFTWLKNMVNTVVRLDPHFVDAYRYGGMFLAALRADDDAGLGLLEHGIRLNPGAWELSSEAAFIYLLNRRDEPGSKRLAAHYLAMSVSTGHAPEHIMALASKLQGQYDLSKIEHQMWTDLFESDDKILRELAARKLQEMELREIRDFLAQTVVYFDSNVGRPASSLEDLVQVGLISGLPVDPLGGRFFIDTDRVVQNTTLLDELKNQTLSTLRSAIQQYHRNQGVWPSNLDALVENGTMSSIPVSPYQDQVWVYNPETGEIR